MCVCVYKFLPPATLINLETLDVCTVSLDVYKFSPLYYLHKPGNLGCMYCVLGCMCMVKP